ncbi:MAG: bifunctional folylpolyglutamate synthase/dihydrofolate synthase [Candidatus Azobacteroides sp.]|nr:bifunctional folylpolyglutamate synthase/dihydrofolate synthase [Candidatus Azobacteroides sp.]
MNYTETIDFLYSQLPVYQKTGGSAYKEGLDNSLYLDKVLDYPHKKYKTIHVAGTNGKGSVSHLLAAVLQSAGYKTGLYTSPHLLDFRERIRINGKMIDQEYVVSFVERVKPVIPEIHPSFFELTMMMAFSWFADQEVDVAIIEVGLGGRLDSTNIITPDLSVITNISFDHMQFLGNTLPSIATEKAGIIKPQVPVVIGEAGNEEIRKVFEEKASQTKSRIVFAEEEPVIREASIDKDGNWVFQVTGCTDLILELGGWYQKKNANTVLKAIEILQSLAYEISPDAISRGFRHVRELTGLNGRWQVIGHAPEIVCDTAHNEAGISRIVEQLRAEKFRQLRIVFGMVNDKEIDHILSLMPPDAVYYFTKASIMRALDENELKEKASVYGIKGNSYPDVGQAIQKALQESAPADMIYIGGSTFVVADALAYFEKNKKEKLIY